MVVNCMIPLGFEQFDRLTTKAPSKAHLGQSDKQHPNHAVTLASLTRMTVALEIP